MAVMANRDAARMNPRATANPAQALASSMLLMQYQANASGASRPGNALPSVVPNMQHQAPVIRKL